MQTDIPNPAGKAGICGPLRASKGSALAGTATIPGDKSLSHRALMLGAVALGETRIAGLLESADVQATAAALSALGAGMVKHAAGDWSVRGLGSGGLHEPASVLDMGNSGTAARLLLGLCASHPFFSVLNGDASLNRRPMRRVTAPLGEMGARFAARSGDRLPLAVHGSDRLLPITYRLPVASAQVKSALLLAALNTAGTTTVIEPVATRDHTERLLPHFGAILRIEKVEGGRSIAVDGPAELHAASVTVPADPSSAALPLVAALLVPGSEIRLPGIGLNPHRAGLLETLREMGADITVENARDAAGEPVGDLIVRNSALRGVHVPPERAPAMIDEYPVLATAAACAEGTTVMEGVGELRVKESDRLAMIAQGLQACGVRVETAADSLSVHGKGKPPSGGATVATALDHRIAMSFLVLGLVTQQPVAVDDATPIATSFPDFLDVMRGLGADIRAV